MVVATVVASGYYLTSIRGHLRDSMPKNLVKRLVMKSRGWPRAITQIGTQPFDRPRSIPCSGKSKLDARAALARGT